MSWPLSDRPDIGTPAAALQDYHWPGNVAQLQLAVRAAAAVAHGRVIGVDQLPADVRPSGRDAAAWALERAEAAVISEVLAAVSGNKTAAARQLGLSRPTLYNKLRTYRI